MNRNNRNNRNNRATRGNFRNTILVGAIVAALALGTTGTSVAQTTDYTLANAPLSQNLQLLQYVQSVANTQFANGNVGATLGAGNSMFVNYSGTAQPITNTGNSLSALAIGNSAPTTASAQNPDGLAGNAIALELLGADGFGNSGLGIGSGQLFNGNIANAAVTANVNGVSVATDLTGYAAGSVTHSGNQIRADVRVNDASNEISGNLPAASFAGKPIAGSAQLFSFAPATLTNVGDITIGNAQFSVGGSTNSGVTLNNSGITVIDDVGATASFTNSGNSIAGSYVGNRGDSQFSAEGANGAPSYAGSVVVSNAQRNQAVPSTLAMQADAISTDIQGSLTGSGSITQSGNTISASVQGNTASNGIAFAKGINIAGTDPGAASTLDLRFQAPAPLQRASATGDLVLLNLQRNNYSDYAASITLAGDIGITATANGATADGTSVTLANDHVTAQAGSNAANNTLSADGASFDALVSAGSNQESDRTSVSAATTGVNVHASLDASNGNQGDISVGTSSISAVAQGNQTSTAVDVAGTQFYAGSGVAGANTFITNAPAGNRIAASTANAGVSVGNVQYNHGTATITANNTDSWLGARYAGTITDGSSTVNGNAIRAGAGANAASTSARLGGTNGSFTAALVNHQYTNTDTISGEVEDAFAGIDTGASVANATLTFSTNTLAASANGNQATNTLATEFTNATLGDGAAWSADSASVSAPGGVGATNAAHAALALASSQVTQDTNFTAGTEGWMGVQIAGVTRNTPTTINDNTTSASAVANQVTNVLDPGVGNLGASGGTATQVASLGNYQYADTNGVSASITTNGPYDSATVGRFRGTLSDSPVTMSGNDASAFVAGTMADNSMAISGTQYATAVAAGPVTVNDGFTSFAATGVSADAAFTLLNAQGGDGGSRTSTATEAGVYLAARDISGSPLTVSDNRISADARDNYASNSLRLDGFSTLASTAALLNAQGSEQGGVPTSVTSTITTGHSTVAGFGAVSASDITVSGNHSDAKAIANTAINSFSVAAGNLDGTSFNLIDDSQRGAVFSNAAGGYLGSADYGLASVQNRNGSVSASNIESISDIQVENASGGSLSVTGNAQSALAQSNSVANALGLAVSRSDANAALLNVQQVATGSDASATVTDDTNGYTFVVFVNGGDLGTTAVVPTTVSNNTVLAQAGLNSASNALDVTASSAINTTGIATVGASNDLARHGYTGAIGDFSLYNEQTSSSGAAATVDPDASGIVVGGAIGRLGSVNGLTVDGNSFAAQASANHAVNAINLGGASSVSATTALNNTQTANTGAVSATTEDAQVGIYDYASANINATNLSVTGNALNAASSGNSASNSINVQPVALNAGFNQATEGSVRANGFTGSTAGASNALLNAQSNAATISATVSASDIGVNTPGGLGGASPLRSSVATVSNNSAMASGSGNSASNAILLAALPTGVASSALVSDQLNSADVTAHATGINIGVVAGTNSTSPVTVSGNTIGAIGVGNSATNHIGIGN